VRFIIATAEIELAVIPRKVDGFVVNNKEVGIVIVKEIILILARIYSGGVLEYPKQQGIFFEIKFPSRGNYLQVGGRKLDFKSNF